MKFSGEKLREAREEAGMTQRELSRKLGINYQSINSYELGDTTPKADLIPDLAFVLDKRFSFFFTPDGKADHNSAQAAQAAPSEEIPKAAGG